jgi:hypothetical protein
MEQRKRERRDPHMHQPPAGTASWLMHRGVRNNRLLSIPADTVFLSRSLAVSQREGHRGGGEK